MTKQGRFEPSSRSICDYSGEVQIYDVLLLKIADFKTAEHKKPIKLKGKELIKIVRETI